MSLYPPPKDIHANLWTRLPDDFRKTDTVSDWAQTNKPGQQIDSFLEGPSFDAMGNLWVVDIPYGRVFRISQDRDWSLVAEYDGWPNGLKIHPNGQIYIADYKNGIMTLDPASGRIQTFLSHYRSEGFRGCNDLFFGGDGRLFFTDQGQSGMHQPDGRVFVFDFETGRLELLVNNCPSPNGLVLNDPEDALYVAMTRANSVWRLPLLPGGGVSKVGVFVQLSGGLSGPDGMALDQDGNLFVAHAGNGCAWSFSKTGEPRYRIRCAAGLTVTNLAFGGPENRDLFFTESSSGSIFRAKVPVPGRRMYSHSAPS
jgi:gluconolactonase